MTTNLNVIYRKLYNKGGVGEGGIRSNLGWAGKLQNNVLVLYIISRV